MEGMSQGVATFPKLQASPVNTQPLSGNCLLLFPLHTGDMPAWAPASFKPPLLEAYTPRWQSCLFAFAYAVPNHSSKSRAWLELDGPGVLRVRRPYPE